MKILGIGLVTVDHVMLLDTHPEPDSKNEARAAQMQIGGPVPIALAQLKRFGWSCHFCSVWGADPFGALVEQRLQTEQIEFAATCRQQSMATSVTQIWIEQQTGQRTLVTARPDCSELGGMLSSSVISQFDVLHLDGWPTETAFLAAQVVKRGGGLVCVDTGSPKPGIERLLKIADVVNCPKTFCERFLGEKNLERAAEKVARFGPRFVSVTDGERGAVLSAAGKTISQPAVTFGPVVDTNGAGDSFSGALIHGVLQDWSPQKILKFAATCAGLKCNVLGNQEALPIESKILELMAL